MAMAGGVGLRLLAIPSNHFNHQLCVEMFGPGLPVAGRVVGDCVGFGGLWLSRLQRYVLWCAALLGAHYSRW